MYGTSARVKITTSDQIVKLRETRAADARKSFWSFRQYVHEDFKSWWWNYEVAMALQQFWVDFRAGKRPKLVLAAPPQHGKIAYDHRLQRMVCW